MKNSLPKFYQKQREFAAYIRNPQHAAMPEDVLASRMAIYRELFFNNIDGFLSNNFPVLRRLLTDQQWFALVQDFFAKHRSETPYFTEIPEEFLAYLQYERDNAADYPFMLELAHYEWVEMALSIAKEQLVPNPTDLSNLIHARVQLSPLAWLLAYQYPVHKISPNFLPTAPPEQATFLIVYRDAHDDVHFLEITPLTYRLLTILQEQESMIVADCLQAIVVELQPSNPDFIKKAGLQILKDLAEKTVLRVGKLDKDV
jgi:uncharacterized protein